MRLFWRLVARLSARMRAQEGDNAWVQHLSGATPCRVVRVHRPSRGGVLVSRGFRWLAPPANFGCGPSGLPKARGPIILSANKETFVNQETFVNPRVSRFLVATNKWGTQSTAPRDSANAISLTEGDYIWIVAPNRDTMLPCLDLSPQRGETEISWWRQPPDPHAPKPRPGRGVAPRRERKALFHRSSKIVILE